MPVQEPLIISITHLLLPLDSKQTGFHTQIFTKSLVPNAQIKRKPPSIWVEGWHCSKCLNNKFATPVLFSCLEIFVYLLLHLYLTLLPKYLVQEKLKWDILVLNHRKVLPPGDFQHVASAGHLQGASCSASGHLPLFCSPSPWGSDSCLLYFHLLACTAPLVWLFQDVRESFRMCLLFLTLFFHGNNVGVSSPPPQGHLKKQKMRFCTVILNCVLKS